MVPGYTGSGPENWQTLWEQRRPNAARVQQRSWTDPIPHEWVQTLERAVAAAVAPPVLVAHSLGTLAVAHWVAAVGPEAAGRVRAAMLVAPPQVERPDLEPVLRRFAPVPRATLPFPSLVVASENDPYAELEWSREVAGAWGSDFVSAGRAGHLNTEAGYGPWPAGEKLLDELIAAT